MKTPKRHHELTTMEHISTERVWDYSQEQVNSQRWKRKNRIKRLKHTISKLTYENAVFKQTFIQKRAFLKRLKAICREPNRSTLHRLAELDRELQMELMVTKDYERKEQNNA